MERFVNMVADEKRINVRSGISLLQGLREKNIMLPSLCFDPRLESYGGCGLCILEVYRKGGWQVLHACMIQAKEGLRIQTCSARISRLRSGAAGLLLKRGPFYKKEVEKMLASMGGQSMVIRIWSSVPKCRVYSVWIVC